MAYDTTITLRTNSTTKAKAQKLFNSLGMDMSTAVNIFLTQSIKTESIPFEITRKEEPNRTTWKAIEEAYLHPEKLEGPYTTEREILEALHA